MKWADYKKEITALDSTEINRTEIVAQLIQRRLELALTQTELAKKSGLKQSAIARLESENAKPRIDTLEKVTNALDLKLTLIKEDNTLYETKNK